MLGTNESGCVHCSEVRVESVDVETSCVGCWPLLSLLLSVFLTSAIARIIGIYLVWREFDTEYRCEAGHFSFVFGGYGWLYGVYSLFTTLTTGMVVFLFANFLILACFLASSTWT